MVLNFSEASIQITSIQRNSRTEISKILSAAIINKPFRDLLLNDPGKAIEQGYHGQMFLLTNDEKNWLRSIKAGSICEFAKIIVEGVPSYQPAM
jgi:hypothetical protein